jgi:hypothetical protein
MPPTTISMLARIASDVYEANSSPLRDFRVTNQRMDGTFVANNSRGFQGAIYQNEEDTVVAYRGTATKGGVTADVLLALRSMPNQVDDAFRLYAQGQKEHGNRTGKLIMCGHSLGGYLAQAVCGFMGSWGIAFNGAGARSLFTGRIFGLGAKYGDVTRTGHLARADKQVLNITIRGDPVSGRLAGKRIGKKIRLAFGNVANAHFMDTVLVAVVVKGYGQMTLEEGLRRASTEDDD